RCRCRLLLVGAANVFRSQSAARRTPVHGIGRRLGPRDDWALVLAAPEALVSTLATDPLRVRAPDADPGNSWRARGRPTGHGVGRGSGLGRAVCAGPSAPGTGGCRVPRSARGMGAFRLRGGAPCRSGSAHGALVLAAPPRRRPLDLSEPPRGADRGLGVGVGGEAG